MPVDLAQTVFRIGSVSKLFTWTAVMQVFERGLLDLHGDVNQYLTDFQLSDTYTEPVTAAHLLTHTAGFESRWIATRTTNPNDLRPLGEARSRGMPKRVEVPGIIYSYSNHGANLAGHLVEQVTGLTFDQYIEQAILQPLGMDGTSFRQPLPAALASNLATGYTYEDGELRAAPQTYAVMAPASAASVTPTDMAAFMIAHLNEGEFLGQRILESTTAQEMHRQHFSHHPDMPGMAYGFKERYINGLRVIGHGGDIQTYSSQLVLVPQEDLGFFVAYNRFDDSFREQLISAFFDRFYPSPGGSAEPRTIEMAPGLLKSYAGSYRWVKYPRSTLGKLIAMVPGPYPIVLRVNDDASLSLSFFGAKVEWRYVPVAQHLFRRVEGGPQLLDGLLVDPGDTLAFLENPAGEIAYGFVPLQNTAFERLAWYEMSEVQLGTLGTTLVIFSLAVVLWPLVALIGLLRKRPPAVHPSGRLAKWLGWLMCTLNLIFTFVFLLLFGEGLVTGVPLVLQLLLVIPIITSILAITSLILALVAWIRGYWSVAGRLFYTLVALASVIFVLFEGYWNMLGWRF